MICRRFNNIIKALCDEYEADGAKLYVTSIKYEWYKPLVLLPRRTFASTAWASFFGLVPEAIFYQRLLSDCFATQCKGCAYLALQAPVAVNDRLRSPRIIPLFGSGDFEALWVEILQNGLYQVWNPLHTMFSKGNIKEKMRIAEMTSKIADTTVADLYSGIGYFAFAYLKAGAARVYCWEINPYSIRGLVQGAKRNNFTLSETIDKPDAQLVLLAQDNVHASDTLRHLPDTISHINLGLLPSNEGAWPTAADILRKDIGGFIHVHGLADLRDTDTWVNYCVTKFTGYFPSGWQLRVDDIVLVKTYAPGVGHMVLDLLCQPILV